MTTENNHLPIINRIDIIKAKKYRGIFLYLFITDDMLRCHHEIMPELNSSQQTFLTYHLFDESMRSGSSRCGFLRVMYNGYGEYVFQKPFSKIVKSWGAEKIIEIVENARVLYEKYKDKMKKIKTREELSDLYLQIADFKTLNHEYMMNQDGETEIIKNYIENNINEFAIIDESNSQTSYIDMDIKEAEDQRKILEDANKFTEYVRSIVNESTILGEDNTLVVSESAIFGEEHTSFTGASLEINGKRIKVKLQRGK